MGCNEKFRTPPGACRRESRARHAPTPRTQHEIQHQTPRFDVGDGFLVAIGAGFYRAKHRDESDCSNAVWRYSCSYNESPRAASVHLVRS